MFASVEKTVGPWEFSATFDLGHWFFGPYVMWRDNWRVLSLAVGPASVTVSWLEPR